MALFTQSHLCTRGATAAATRGSDRILQESAKVFSRVGTHDIFLSHSFADAAVILGLKKTLEGFGFSVYVDWTEDPTLDRSRVTPATAAVLRERMRSCRALLYDSSPNATASKWMPGELAYFDGYKGRVAVVPRVESNQSSFVGQEYLGLYPYVDQDTATQWATVPLDQFRQPSTRTP